jgi:hypothetical protein
MWERSGHSQGALIVGGQDLSLGAETVFNFSVIEDVKSLIPSIHLSFLDDKIISKGLGLFQDGSSIQAIMGDGKNSTPTTWNFTQWALNKGKATANGNVVELSGVANIVPWLSQVVTKAHKGNASDVAQQIGQMAGINLFDISSTNDKMTWLPDGKTLGNFARKVMDHAWIGDGSTPHMAITSQAGQWMMRIKDIMQKGSGSVNFVSYGLANPGDIPLIDYVIESHSGALNSYSTFGHKVVQEKLNGKVDIWQNFTFSSLVGSIGIDSSLKQLVRTFYHSPESGNCVTGATLIPTEKGLLRIIRVLKIH